MTSQEQPRTILDHFRDLDDPRMDRSGRHNPLDIAAIAVCAVICGADNWGEAARFGEARRGWLSGFLELSNGVPSHDTFGRVFSLLDPNRFSRRFTDWVRSISVLAEGEVVAIDGKTGAATTEPTGRLPFMVIRHMALNRLSREKSAKVGITAKRKMAGWDNDYLLKVSWP